jgi:transcriptional regulator with XRE-family HTH domain
VDFAQIGSRIRKLRGAVLQEDLAAYLGVTQGHLSKLESGKIAPSLNMLVLVAKRFHTSIDWIVLGRESSTKEDGSRTL